MQLTIYLPATTAVELQRLANAERRRPRDQATILIERALAERAPKTEECAVTV